MLQFMNLKKSEGINEILNYSGGLNANSSSLAVINRIKPYLREELMKHILDILHHLIFLNQ